MTSLPSSCCFSSRNPRRVLIVLHQEHSIPGRLGRLLMERGFVLDIRRPRFGDPLPETMDAFAGAVIFGGPQSANDPDDYVRAEIDWIGVPLREQRPFLGICLGAQMLAMHLGARVGPHPRGLVEIGYYDVQPTDAGRALIPDWPAKVYHWHSEGFEVPPAGASLLAEGTSFPNQAFAVGPAAFGLQFHPELTLAQVHKWTTKAASRMAVPGARPAREHFEERRIHDPHVLSWLDQFLDLWIGTAAAPQFLPQA